MRALIVAPIVIGLVLLVSRALTLVTGDPLSAVTIELIVFVTVSAWLAGPPRRRAPARDRG